MANRSENNEKEQRGSDRGSNHEDVHMTDAEGVGENRPSPPADHHAVAPKLSNLNPRNIIQFQDKYLEYVGALTDGGKKPRDMRTMIDGTLLDVISEIFIKKPKAEVTDEDLNDLFEDRLKSDTSSLSDMPSIIRRAEA